MIAITTMLSCMTHLRGSLTGIRDFMVFFPGFGQILSGSKLIARTPWCRQP